MQAINIADNKIPGQGAPVPVIAHPFTAPPEHTCTDREKKQKTNPGGNRLVGKESAHGCGSCLTRTGHKGCSGKEPCYSIFPALSRIFPLFPTRTPWPLASRRFLGYFAETPYHVWPGQQREEGRSCRARTAPGFHITLYPTRRDNKVMKTACIEYGIESGLHNNLCLTQPFL